MLENIGSFIKGIFQKRSSTSALPPRRTLSFNSVYSTETGVQVTEDTAVSWTAIWRGIQLVGSALGSMPFTIIQEDEAGNSTLLKQHPLWPLVNIEPHPFYSTFDYLQAIAFQVLLRGNAVVVINRAEGGSNRPTSLRVIPWQSVIDIVETLDGRLLYKIAGYPEPISHENIIHIKGLTKDGVVGIDALLWNKESFGLALSTKRSTAAYHKHGTHSDGFLSTDQTLETPVRQDIQKSFNDMTSNGETPLLSGGVSWQKMGVTPKEIQLLEARQFNVYEAARILGIPPHLLYAMDGANFSNVETMSLEFVKFNLTLIVEKVEQEHSRKLFRAAEKGIIKVNLNMGAFLRGDTRARAEYIQTLINTGVLSIDEARKIEGWNTLESEKGKTRFVPGGYQTLETMLKAENNPLNTPKIEAKRKKVNGVKVVENA